MSPTENNNETREWEERDEEEVVNREWDEWKPDRGPKSETRTISVPMADSQQSMIGCAMGWYDHPLVLSLVRSASGYTYGKDEIKVHDFFNQERWDTLLYGALINTVWTDTRNGLEYSLSFRESSGVCAFLTGVLGGVKGDYMDGPYCTINYGYYEAEDHSSPGILFIKSLGFQPGVFQRGRLPTGNTPLALKMQRQLPPFVVLPDELQFAINKYASGGEGLVGLADKLAPCVGYRNPDPDEIRAAKRARGE